MISPRANKQETVGPKTRPHYSQDFKEDAVNLLARPESNIGKVAAGLGISQVTLRNWRRQLSGGRQEAVGELSPQQLQAENRRLKAELDYITMQRDILKKACGILSVPVKGMPQ